MTGMKKLRIGIAGRRGVNFCAGLKDNPEVELSALCDLDSVWLAKMAQELEVPRTFSQFDEMLDSVDAVIVATPMQLHAEHVICAINAGKHVMSEVTAAVTLDECWRILDAVESSQSIYFFSENYCYIKENVLIRSLVKEGFFGDLYYGEGEYLHDVKAYHHFPDGSPTWRAAWQVGQPGLTYPTHSLGPIMQWFGELDPSERVESVICLGSGRHTDPEHPHDDTSIGLCRLRSGKLIRLRLDMMSNRPHQMTYYALQGTKGVYEASRDAKGSGQVWFGENPPSGFIVEEHRSWKPIGEFDDHLPSRWRNPPKEALAAGHGGGDYWVIQDFVDACFGRVNPAIDVYDGLHWTAVGLCSTLSIQSDGMSIQVPDFRNPRLRLQN